MENMSMITRRNLMHQVVTQLICLAWLALAGGSVEAATMSWTNSAGGDVTNAANWSPGLPGPNDTASFGLNNAYIVDVTAPAVTNLNMRFNAANGGPVLLNLGSSTLMLTDAEPLDLSVTAGVRTNTLIINGGTVLLTNNTYGTGPWLSSGNANGNSTLILSNVFFNTYQQFIGADRYGSPSGHGSLVISGGTNITRDKIYSGSTGTSSLMLTGNNPMMVVSNLITLGGANSTGILTVASGSLSALGGINLGTTDAGSRGILNLLGGTTNVSGASLNAGYYYGSMGSGSVVMSGSNTLLIVTNGGAVGIGSSIANPSQMTISNSTVLSYGGLAVAPVSNQKGSLLIDGGTFSILSGTLHVSFNFGSSSNMFGDVVLTGTGSAFNTLDGTWIGGEANSIGRVTVSNGIWTSTGRIWAGIGSNAVGLLTVAAGGTINVLPTAPGMWLGTGAGGGYGQLNVSAGTFRYSGDGTPFYIGGSAATGSVYVSNMGVFEANTINVTPNCPSTVINNGGIFQYTTATPSITPGAFGTVVITNGTVSFRAINNADVTCNQGTKALRSDTVMLWAGTSNTFRLNNATNSGTIDQTYTFAPGIATNFARLELLDSSTYRNGKVTIGANGSLYLSGGASTLSSVLTAAPSSTIEFDLSNSNAPACLLSTTNVYLNNCTLQLDLAIPPIVNTSYLIISNSLASQLSYSFAGGSTKQNFTINGTNYLTTITLAGGGTEVVVRTTIPARGTTAFFR